MATSIQTIGQEFAMFEDLDLIVLMRMMLDEVGKEPERFSSLLGVAVTWESCCKHYGPGTVELDLDTIAASASTKVSFLNLLDVLKERLESHGPILAASEMKRHWRVRGVVFADYETSRLLAGLKRVRQLVQR